MDVGWRLLQAGDVTRANQAFAEISARRRDFHPSRTAEAYVALARQDFAHAVTAFDAALALVPAYAPALVGQGQTLLALAREDDARAAFEAAQAADPALDLRARIEVLTFRRVQRVIEAARAAAASGDTAGARAGFDAALEASPESAFLYRELGVLEMQQGQATSALARFRQAVALDPSDAVSWSHVGDILAGLQDVAGAREAYQSAVAADPSLDLADRIAEMSEGVRVAALPAPLRAAASSAQVTRGDLAAIIVDRLGAVLVQAPARQAVVTDTRGHWAAEAIALVMRAGVLDPFTNHTFQPRGPVRRAELATAASRIVALVSARGGAQPSGAASRPVIADMNPTHLDYPAASRVVAAGVMVLVSGRFLPARPVSGAEATETVERLRRLALELPPSRP